MAVEFSVVIKCDYCYEKVASTATVVGKHHYKGKIQVSTPDGWALGVETGYGHTPSGFSCGCPEHAAQVRGY